LRSAPRPHPRPYRCGGHGGSDSFGAARCIWVPAPLLESSPWTGIEGAAAPCIARPAGSSGAEGLVRSGLGGDRVGSIVGMKEVVVETERLLLRAYRLDDYDSIREMSGAPEMFRYSEREAMTPEEAWGRLLRHVGHWQIYGYGIFAVEEKASRRYVGEAGVAHFRRSLGADFDPFPESTWSIAPEAQGQGYAQEAAAGALAWLTDGKEKPQTVCLIHIGNAPSLRVAEKLGYRPIRQVEYRGYPAVLFRREEKPRPT
jgi:RimJ/RimL family protein N-acetyltransferase